MTEKLEFISPFNTFEDDELPEDPLSKETIRWMNRDGITSVPWIFTSFPSEVFKEELSSALLEYVQGQTDWTSVRKRTVDSWKNEK